jgi:ABC-2 type transport system permease protein
MLLFLTQLRFELVKMFARKRTYIGFAAFLAMEIIVIYFLNQPRPQARLRHLIEQNGYGFDDYYSGVTLATLMLLWTPQLRFLYLALVAGDLMSKEIEEGTMRMLLCRPISRIRVALLKYISALIYTFVLMEFIAVTALLAGIAYRGFGGLFVFAPQDGIFAVVPTDRALQIYLLATPFLALSAATISSLGFLFSCCNMKPAAASIVTLSVIMLDFILTNLPFFESLKPLFITTHLAAWIHIFEAHPPWWRMTEDFSYLGGIDVSCFIIGTAIFMRRDLK